MTVTDKIRESCAGIAEQYQLDLMILYGSRAKGTGRKDSDTDVAVRAFHRFSPDKQLEIARALDKVFPECEVVDLRQCSPLLLAAIAKDGVVLFQRESTAFADFVILARNQFIEYLPQYEKLKEKNRKRLAELSK